MRKYPEPSDYQAAIQNPHLVLHEPELRAARVRVDRLGMPLVNSGGFALSFYLQAPNGSQWVVRCFKADSPDRRARYDAISRFLNANPDPLLLDVDYAEEGIRVDGALYPVVKMPLVRGGTLQRYVETEIAGGRNVAHLSGKFRAVVERLKQLGIAHGDLQHGNIMVQNGELVLVDYDGMYVPELRGWPAAEMGSAAYQHPLRRGQFSPALDRFSAIVIDMALQALVAAPGLWPKYNTGENLLFRQADFTHPDRSPLLRDLEQIPHLARAVHELRTICQGPFDAIPTLDSVMPPLPDVVPPAVLPGMPQVIKSQFVWRAGVDDVADIDEQLTRLYANWIPTTAATNTATTPTPVPVQNTGWLTGGVFLPAAPGPLASPAPTPTPTRRQPAVPVKPPMPWSKSDMQAFGQSARRAVFAILTIAWVLTHAGSWFSSPARNAWADAVPTPYPAVFDVSAWQPQSPIQLVSPLPAGRCPTDLYVYLKEPHGAVRGNVATFAWMANQQLPPACHYRLKLWRADGSTIPLAADQPVIATPNGYQTSVSMTGDFPQGQQYGGRFFWTVELVDSTHGNKTVAVHGLPRAFDWLAQ